MKTDRAHKTKKVLVIEDDPYTNELICTTLKMAGYQVVTTYNGIDGLEQAKKEMPDLIVLDLLLPQVDGWEVCRRLRMEDSETRSIPIVIASIASRFDLENSKMSMGTISFFNKPFEPTELVSEVKRVLGGGTAQ